MRATASAYLRESKIYLHSEALTTSRWRIYPGEPPRCLDVADSDADIGSAVKDVLAAFRTGVPHPDRRDIDDPSTMMAPLLRVAGAKSWKAFVRTAVEVAISSEGPDVMFMPGCRRGESFVGLGEEATLRVTDASNAQLGVMLREALRRSQ